jgi:hypothetical protein
MSQHDVKVVTKLNRETKEGKIKWEVNRSKPSSLSGTEILVENVYTAQVLNKKFRLYKYQSKYFRDEESYEWTESFRLEFIDDWGNSEWTFPDDRSVYDLYSSVRYKTSNIEKFVDDFLTDEEKNEKGDKPFDF